MSAAVTESGRPLQAAVTGSGRYRRPLQEAGGGDGSGRCMNNALRQDASTLHARLRVTKYIMQRNTCTSPFPCVADRVAHSPNRPALAVLVVPLSCPLCT